MNSKYVIWVSRNVEVQQYKEMLLIFKNTTTLPLCSAMPSRFKKEKKKKKHIPYGVTVLRTAKMWLAHL